MLFEPNVHVSRSHVLHWLQIMARDLICLFFCRSLLFFLTCHSFCLYRNVAVFRFIDIITHVYSKRKRARWTLTNIHTPNHRINKTKGNNRTSISLFFFGENEVKEMNTHINEWERKKSYKLMRICTNRLTGNWWWCWYE